MSQPSGRMCRSEAPRVRRAPTGPVADQHLGGWSTVTDGIWTPEPRWMSWPWWQKFERQPNGCLLWTGTTDRAGYGRSKGNGPAAGEPYVHRIVYKLLVGPIPPRGVADIDHICHNEDETCRGKGNACLHRRCGEPTHLLLTTHAENKRGALKTHCKRGHRYAISSSGKRVCHDCARDRAAEFRARVRDGIVAPPSSWYQPTGRPPGRPRKADPASP
jgi:hypothetical protein